MTQPATKSTLSLLHDGALVVTADETLLPAVRAWLPLHAEAPALGDIAREDRATIDVTADAAASDAPDAADDAPPLVLFAGVRAREMPGETISLRGTSAARGRIELSQKRAHIIVPPHGAGVGPGSGRGGDGVGTGSTPGRTGVGPESGRSPAGLAADVYSMLTLCAAFLIGRLGGALVHAGAVVDPDGRAWLLAGDTHAGKTTTCVSLVDAGWSFLADDQVVLRRDDDGGLVAEGWPRDAHLDEGWSESVVTGARATLDLRARWSDRWQRRAPLGGLLFPNVHAEAPTSAISVHAAWAFAALVRQSPWLMADPGAAPMVLDLLRDACARPAFALALGRDGYARGDVIAERLASARGSDPGL